MKLLVVKPTALGDVAQALQVVPALKERGFCQELVWLIDEDYRALVACCPWVDRTISFPRKRWRKKFPLTEIMGWARDLRRERFDVVLDLQGLARSGLMTWMSGAGRRVGLRSAREGACRAYTETVSDDRPHAVARYGQAVSYLLREDVRAGVPYLDQAAGPLPFGLKKGSYMLIHPYSQWDTKMWPWRNYNYLIRNFPNETFVLAGKGPFFPCEGIENCIDLRNRTSLGELIAVIRGARVVISTDSGPAHVAAAFNRPLIVLFGATDPEKTSPFGDAVSILSVDLECRPCLSRRCRLEVPMACLTGLGVEQVTRELAKISSSSD